MGVFVDLDDLRYLPGDGSAIRAGASQIRSSIGDLRTARVAAVRIEDILAGDHWRGEAFQMFRQATERKPLVPAIDRAADRMEQAASQLDWFAARFEENQQTIRWCRSRLYALGLGCGAEVPPELVDEVRRILADAQQAWERHRAALESVASAFDWLDDEPTFAKPPPSTIERVGGFIGGVAVGAGRATVQLVDFAWEASLYGNPITGPWKWREAWGNRDQIGAVLSFAWNNPGEFATELGKAFIDFDTWVEDGVAVWLGKRIPDIVLTIATGGMGRVGTGAAQAVRSLRGGRVADTLVDLAGVSHRLAPADLGRSRSVLGRLGQRLAIEGEPNLSIGRQLPGVLNDEIRGVTAIPGRALRHEFPDSPLAGAVTGPRAQWHLDNVLTNGATGKLGVLDGLLAGAPNLSPEMQAAMAVTLGASVTESLASGADILSTVHDAAVEANR